MRAYSAPAYCPIAVHAQNCVPVLGPSLNLEISIGIGAAADEFSMRRAVPVYVFKGQEFFARLATATARAAVRVKHALSQFQPSPVPKGLGPSRIRLFPLYLRCPIFLSSNWAFKVLGKVSLLPRSLAGLAIAVSPILVLGLPLKFFDGLFDTAVSAVLFHAKPSTIEGR